jgi:hypothetical protein
MLRGRVSKDGSEVIITRGGNDTIVRSGGPEPFPPRQVKGLTYCEKEMKVQDPKAIPSSDCCLKRGAQTAQGKTDSITILR